MDVYLMMRLTYLFFCQITMATTFAFSPDELFPASPEFLANIAFAAPAFLKVTILAQ
jgi:hypothetical protein